MQLCHGQMALLFMLEARTPLGFFFPGRRPILFACTTRPFDFCYSALPFSLQIKSNFWSDTFESPGPERKYPFKEFTDCCSHEGRPQISTTMWKSSKIQVEGS